MTHEEFNNLPIEKQEEFINSGGVISKDGETKKEEDIINGSLGCVEKFVSSSKSSANDLISPSLISQSDVRAVLSDEERQAATSECSLPSSEAKELLSSQPVTFDIRDPVELLFLLDNNIASGNVKLHDWQIQFMIDFADSRHTKEFPFLANVRACNGSGKDMYVVAACVVWLCMKYANARGVVTNGSGVQLDNQTELHISNLCEKVKRKFSSLNLWKCNYRYYECLAVGSPIVLFATDEPGKAEGFHPIEPSAPMAIFTSESKSIPDDIFTALSRCNGATHRINVSSPGAQRGYFYEKCSTSIPRKELKDIKETSPGDYIEYHITAYDCPHISPAEIKGMAEDMPGGENGDAFKSAVKAEFGSGEEMVVIQYTYVWKATRYTKEEQESLWIPEEFNKAGLDLADGGAETVLFVRNGNKALKLIPFRFNDSEDTIDFLEPQFEENGLTNKEALIFGDCVGIGKPILDRLKKRGWKNIRYIDSRRASSRPKTYRNYNAQMWFDFAKLMTQKELILLPDKKLIAQLSGRLFKIVDGCIHQLLSKLEMRSRGFPSPDRADACVFSFTDYKSTFIEEKDKNKEKPFEIEEEKPIKSEFSLKSSCQNNNDYKRKYKVNGGQKDFRDIQDEIMEYNRSLVLTK